MLDSISKNGQYITKEIIYKKDCIKLLWPDFIFITILIWIQALGSAVTTITYIGLIFYAVLSNEASIKALTMGMILTFLNPGIFPGSDYVYLLKWILLFSAASRIYINRLISYKKISTWIIYLFIFCAFSLLFSLINSYAIFVSCAKIIIFFVGASCIYLGFKHTSSISWNSWFYTFFSAILISSLPLLPLSVGYVKNSSGFQGILSHPQTYGVYMVVPIMWLTGRWLVNKKTSVIFKIIILGGWITIFASRARAAILAAVLGILFTVVIAFFKRPSWNKSLLIMTRKPVFIVIIFLVIIVMIFPGNIAKEAVENFIYKNPGSIYENIYHSRGFLIKRSWENFKKSPLIGTGFGVASIGQNMGIKRLKFMDIPISAPSEKGFLFSALLEEVGIIGTFLFLLFLFKLMEPIVKYGDLPSMWLFACAFFVTFAEMAFFSFGGLGMHIWLCFGLALYGNRKTNTEQEICVIKKKSIGI